MVDDSWQKLKKAHGANLPGSPYDDTCPHCKGKTH